MAARSEITLSHLTYLQLSCVKTVFISLYCSYLCVCVCVCACARARDNSEREERNFTMNSFINCTLRMIKSRGMRLARYVAPMKREKKRKRKMRAKF
jgi:hypothetical protein